MVLAFYPADAPVHKQSDGAATAHARAWGWRIGVGGEVEPTGSWFLREGGVVGNSVKKCASGDWVLKDRVEEEVRTGSSGSRSTGVCDAYRIWACMNQDCVMYKTDLERELVSPDG